MSAWQWSVIVALCRIVIRLVAQRDDIPWDEQSLLEEAIWRSE